MYAVGNHTGEGTQTITSKELKGFFFLQLPISINGNWLTPLVDSKGVIKVIIVKYDSKFGIVFVFHFPLMKIGSWVALSL